MQAGTAYTMDQLRGMYFVPAAGSSGGTADIAYVLQDDGGTDGGGVDRSTGVLQLRIETPPFVPAPTAPPGGSVSPAPAPAPAPAPPPARWWVHPPHPRPDLRAAAAPAVAATLRPRRRRAMRWSLPRRPPPCCPPLRR
ncbi:hypothetical protein HK414_16470 [Ramlibacter terrae]|uniref:Uncharacterized protein n=1 Tax=Ramlibacter terrae TaxID=2732511 RepID=A0ABX6P0I5_9BURK|nr:hypothetical protein HK414_16470 [Ramlibacter terrae]